MGKMYVYSCGTDFTLEAERPHRISSWNVSVFILYRFEYVNRETSLTYINLELYFRDIWISQTATNLLLLMNEQPRNNFNFRVFE